MRVKVLGSAAGGGFPQWNCGCSNCARLRAGTLKGRARTQAQVAVSPTPGAWLLLNASPDLRQQLTENPEFAPSQKSRSTPVAAIILTSADADCVTGLLHLREFQPLEIYSTASVRRILAEENGVFRVLDRSRPPASWQELHLNEPRTVFQAPGLRKEAALVCRAISVGGEYPDYVSEELRRQLPAAEAVVGLELAQNERRLFYAPNLSGQGEDWKHAAGTSQLALLDGTFWSDEELSAVLGNSRTARQMGHLPLSGPRGLLEEFRGGCGRRALIHMNNTNPVLDEESVMNRAVRQAGWEIAYDGMEFDL